MSKKAICPKCDCEELGVKRIIKCWDRIHNWIDEDYDDLEEEDWTLIGLDSPPYYCCGCGHEFWKPVFLEVYE